MSEDKRKRGGDGQKTDNERHFEGSWGTPERGSRERDGGEEEKETNRLGRTRGGPPRSYILLIKNVPQELQFTHSRGEPDNIRAFPGHQDPSSTIHACLHPRKSGMPSVA